MEVSDLDDDLVEPIDPRATPDDLDDLDDEAFDSGEDDDPEEDEAAYARGAGVPGSEHGDLPRPATR